MAKCNQYEYESTLTPNAVKQIGNENIVMVVDSLDSISDPQPNFIYIVDGKSYIYVNGEFESFGNNLPLDIRLYGTWSGHLDELVYEGQAKTQQIDTGINIQNAPNDLIYFFFTVECDGEYGEDVDLVADNVWSGATMGWFGRSYVNGNLSTYSSAGYNKVVRPQNVNDLLTVVNSGSLNGISLNNNNEKVLLYRSVSGQGSYSVRRIMGGNYTVNVYALKLGNFQ